MSHHAKNVAAETDEDTDEATAEIPPAPAPAETASLPVGREKQGTCLAAAEEVKAACLRC
jgi:hypothetical protein